MTTESITTYTTRLDDPANDLALSGGKGANLATLVGAGFPVPSGFVVTTDAYRTLIDTPALRSAISKLDTLDETDTEALAATAEEIRSLVRGRALDDAITQSITDALDTVTNASYAVRSSATAEDLPSASFAGQHDSHLGVSGDDVLDAVRECMASLFTDRAVAYRARNDISHAEVAMAVVIQEMADAEAAGVLFTADPDTNNRTVTSIDATFGLGDTVVSGEISADNARVKKSTKEVLDYEVGSKETELALTGEGTESVTASADQRERRALSDRQLATLVELGNRVERLFDAPQDIEWALVDSEASADASNGAAEPQSGDFVVLQSRPITSLIAPPEPRPDDGRLHVYMSVGHAQAMTDPMPPLALDVWETVYGGMLNGMSGGDRAWVTRTEGRAYLDITPFLGFGAARDGIVETIGVMNESAGEGTARLLAERSDEFGGNLSLASLPTFVRKTVGALPMIVKLIPGLVRESLLPFVRGAEGTDEYRDWFHAWGTAQEAKILDEDDPQELVENALAGFSSDVVFEITPKSMRVLVGPVVGGALKRLVPGADTQLVDAAARGDEHEVGTRMTLSLGDLADIARETPAIEQAILAERPYEEIREIDGSEAFVERFERFLSDFGHRVASELDPSRPRWRDDPSRPLGIVRGNLVGEERGAHRERLSARKREATDAISQIQANASHGLLGLIRRPLADRLIETYRSHINLRDEPKHGTAHIFAAWHEAPQRAGEHLVREGVLTEADDVWFLRCEELLDLLHDPTGDLPDIESRRTAHERHERTDVPPLITSEGEIPHAERADLGENALGGTGVAPGTIEGTARIVHDPTNASLESGDVLVCPSSDPAWTPLFATASGLVTEVGGRFTHGAVVAREYGLPAVASVTGATDRITDGQIIRVDGTQGIVEILDG